MKAELVLVGTQRALSLMLVPRLLAVLGEVLHPLRDGIQLAEAQHGGKTLEDQIWLQELALVSAAWPARMRTASATSLLP